MKFDWLRGRGPFGLWVPRANLRSLRPVLDVVWRRVSESLSQLVGVSGAGKRLVT